MLLSAEKSRLLLIDVQEKLLPITAEPDQVISKSSLLLRAAELLSIPVLVSEQYPKGLGSTVKGLAAQIPETAQHFTKIHFSCWSDPVMQQAMVRGRETRPQMVLCGIETHICVLQTALELYHAGFEVAVAIDACSSRCLDSIERASARMTAQGVQVVTVEMVLFEWLGRAGTEAFRQISRWVQ